MRSFHRFTIASFVAVPLLVGSVRAQGHDLAVDFRMTESGTSGGKPVNGSGTGHTIISKDRVRFDMKGNTRMMTIPGRTQAGDVTFISLENGKTLVYLLPTTKQYLRINPAEMMEGAQKMMRGMGATMAMNITGDDPKVENLGAGPVILGHRTRHYRVTGNMKVSISVMGQNQTMQTSSVSDSYLAPDLAHLADPFRDIGSNAPTQLLGPGASTYLEKMKAARAKLPPGLSLRTETHLKTSGTAQTSDIVSVQETTGIQNTTASPALFEVPAGYTMITMPTMPTMPPQRGHIPSTKH